MSADVAEIIQGCLTGDTEKISEGYLHLSLDVAGTMMPVNPMALKRLADLGFKFAKTTITEGKVTQETYKLTHVPNSYAKPAVTQGTGGNANSFKDLVSATEKKQYNLRSSYFPEKDKLVLMKN